MSSIDKATETQLKNIQTKTGKTLSELREIVVQSGLSKHSEIRDMLKEKFGLGFGDANTLAHFTRQPAAAETQSSPPSSDAILDGIYTGPKAALRPIHDKLMAAINTFGAFEIAPKKGYVSLRRKKQFTMIGPATNSRVEVGLNMKGLEATDRLVAMPSGSMCQYTVKLTEPDQVDEELIGWIKIAYESAG
ncbi:MAG: DUF4287 domain-containing protein [Anaerolinea sp.]|nr:DUF4287 domain-containing protein [Anaerolinea sp.]MCC6975843.1 DUF4287 domain-containing protein [Anaerolineae bacterium]CAG1000949.1 hypothetical protein ANRL4_03136 [Anaerolineae bacterium]